MKFSVIDAKRQIKAGESPFGWDVNPQVNRIPSPASADAMAASHQYGFDAFRRETRNGDTTAKHAQVKKDDA